jgi:hypothetical protein
VKQQHQQQQKQHKQNVARERRLHKNSCHKKEIKGMTNSNLKNQTLSKAQPAQTSRSHTARNSHPQVSFECSENWRFRGTKTKKLVPTLGRALCPEYVKGHD